MCSTPAIIADLEQTSAMFRADSPTHSPATHLDNNPVAGQELGAASVLASFGSSIHVDTREQTSDQRLVQTPASTARVAQPNRQRRLTSARRLRSCAPCAASKRTCDHGTPCGRCARQGLPCVVLQDRRRQGPRHNPGAAASLPFRVTTAVFASAALRGVVRAQYVPRTDGADHGLQVDDDDVNHDHYSGHDIDDALTT